ncbi:hypothetical protein TNCV_4875541 [Trichonephila clavipes]|nr:hypothetical protein TNCV_4875541 [Trichonephila clavipes]
MANYSKCPLYPKPRKGATIKPNYTTIVNSLVRPNVSFAQAAAQQEKNKNTAPTPQQMAPRIGQVPTTITAQTQAATTHIAKQQKPKQRTKFLSSDVSSPAWLLATDHGNLNHGQRTWTTPNPSLLTTTTPTEDVSALDRSPSVHAALHGGSLVETFHTTGSTTTERPSIKTDSPLLCHEMTSLLRQGFTSDVTPVNHHAPTTNAKESTAPREPQRILKTLYYFTQDEQTNS